MLSSAWGKGKEKEGLTFEDEIVIEFSPPPPLSLPPLFSSIPEGNLTCFLFRLSSLPLPPPPCLIPRLHCSASKKKEEREGGGGGGKKKEK